MGKFRILVKGIVEYNDKVLAVERGKSTESGRASRDREDWCSCSG